MKQFHIYKITNIINKKIYIGKTSGKYPKIRFGVHLKKAISKNGRDECPKLYRSIRKYGKENFIFEVIKSFEAESDKIAYDVETLYIKKFNSVKKGLNCKENGAGAEAGEKNYFFGKGHLITGDKNPMYGKTGELNPFYGKTHSEEILNYLRRKSAKFNDQEILEIKLLLQTGCKNSEVKKKFPNATDKDLSCDRKGTRYGWVAPEIKLTTKWRNLKEDDAKQIIKMWEEFNQEEHKLIIDFYQTIKIPFQIIHTGKISAIVRGIHFKDLERKSEFRRRLFSDDQIIMILSLWEENRLKMKKSKFGRMIIEKFKDWPLTLNRIYDILSGRKYENIYNQFHSQKLSQQ